MRGMMTKDRVIRTVAAAVAVLMLAAVRSPAAYVITRQNKRIEGTAIRANSRGDVILTTSVGQQTFTKDQYLRAVADEPAEFGQAKRLAAAGKFDEAVQLLEDIVKKYQYLEWDRQAMAVLPQIYLGKGDYAAAVRAFEELGKMVPGSLDSDDLMWNYREALLRSGEYSKLTQILEDTIESGSRDDAAKAQMMRGDAKRAQGQLEPAVLDYLRTMVLFKAQTDVQPEATFKAAEVLEEMRDRRAKDLYRSVAEDFPSSPYASQARAKL